MSQTLSVPLRTGWPAPALAQDDHRPLFRWFASKPDARRLVRDAFDSRCTGLPHECAALKEAALDARTIVERLQFMAANDPHLSVIGRETLEAAAALLSGAADAQLWNAYAAGREDEQEDAVIHRSDYDKGCGVAPDGAYICNCGACE
jgi:hypothetical protein